MGMRNTMRSEEAPYYIIKSKTLLTNFVRVWLECHGENPGDVENLGPISYYPGTGFPASYYPYLNQVFAQFKKGL